MKILKIGCFSEALIETSSIALASAINIVRGDEGGGVDGGEV